MLPVQSLQLSEKRVLLTFERLTSPQEFSNMWP
jgi:hypothetical protein